MSAPDPSMARLIGYFRTACPTTYDPEYLPYYINEDKDCGTGITTPYSRSYYAKRLKQTKYSNHITTPPSNSKIFSTLSFDIINCILFSIDDLNDLHNFILSSPTIYGIFERYRNQTLHKVAGNMFGDAWDDLKTLLVYQRSDVVRYKTLMRGSSRNAVDFTTDDYAALTKSLRCNFEFQVGDIPRLIQNHQFHNMCSKAGRQYFRTPFKRIVIDSDPGSLPCSFNHSIPAAFFYKMWVLSFRFGYEDMKTFMRRPSLTRQETADLYHLSRIILTIPDWWKEISYPCVKIGYIPFRISLRNDMFSVMFTFRETGQMTRLWSALGYTNEMYQKSVADNPLVYHKMKHHLRYLRTLSSSITNFEDDFVSMNHLEITEKYNLSLGWEDEDTEV